MQGGTTPKRGGWIVVAAGALGAAAAAGAALARTGAGEDGLRAAIRATATTSLALFLAAYVARPLQALRPGAIARALLRHRRGIGLAFAASQALHGALVIALATQYPASFWARVATTTLAGGLLGYLVTAAMALTSSDRAAAWLGRRRWRLLHAIGMHYLFVVFAFSYVGRVTQPWYALLTAALGSAAALRGAAWVRAWSKGRQRRRVAPASSGEQRPGGRRVPDEASAEAERSTKGDAGDMRFVVGPPRAAPPRKRPT